MIRKAVAIKRLHESSERKDLADLEALGED